MYDGLLPAATLDHATVMTVLAAYRRGNGQEPVRQSEHSCWCCRREIDPICHREPGRRSVDSPPSQHPAAMSQEPSLVIHQTSAHHSCRICIHRHWLLDATSSFFFFFFYLFLNFDFFAIKKLTV